MVKKGKEMSVQGTKKFKESMAEAIHKGVEHMSKKKDSGIKIIVKTVNKKDYCKDCKQKVRKATLENFRTELKELQHFNKVAEQGKYPTWLRGYNTAIDSMFDFIEAKLKEAGK